jgi:hypothetical protein
MNEHLQCHKQILLHQPILRKTDLYLPPSTRDVGEAFTSSTLSHQLSRSRFCFLTS